MTNLSAIQIAKLTAMIEGGGHKRSATKDKAIAKLTAALAAADRADLIDAIMAAPDFDAARALIAAPTPKAEEAPMPSWAKNLDKAASIAEGRKNGDLPPAPAPKPKADPAPAPADREILNGTPLPKPTTKTRIMLDMMRRPEGTTREEIVKAGGIDVTLAGYQKEWADKYGLNPVTKKEGRVKRYLLA
ncbi:MAG: DUF3489 domain-containing protein [Loktanella sp.]|nr:DUF3489 domain-containing protein [Loktanella sp.]